ncbi:general secretion pathway protein GspB [Wenzhouxiangella sp. XN24]|uniref:general secretion pathway protein GspB n=1 Tax=Wenzhouxiangella sp. XN24 TaxID=2713569 RepID=UPI0013ECA003|nr:general secretion pathway protein GspB [Wenzhouxiangella sp. XN24]NGX17291.1 GspB domain-containing protein [Wenzhouxiangella sp. XN24]
MSLILDALRKSEHQRQREGGPGLAIVPESTSPRRPGPWTLLLGGLLLLNLVVIAAVFLFDGDEAGPVVADPPAAPAQGVTRAAPTASTGPRTVSPVGANSLPPAGESTLRSAPVTLPTRPPRNEVRSLTTETAPRSSAASAEPRRPEASSTPQSGSVARGPDTTETSGSGSTASGPARTSPGTDRQAGEDARLPRFADLVVRGELAVPNMHIDIHVYSAVADERFVFINMRRYNEGQKTQEGPVVERIVTDGVVMEHQGQRFFMPRD